MRVVTDNIGSPVFAGRHRKPHFAHERELVEESLLVACNTKYSQVLVFKGLYTGFILFFIGGINSDKYLTFIFKSVISLDTHTVQEE